MKQRKNSKFLSLVINMIYNTSQLLYYFVLHNTVKIIYLCMTYKEHLKETS